MKLSTFSGIYDLTFNLPISKDVNIDFSIPYMTMNHDIVYANDENGFGNVYLGIKKNIIFLMRKVHLQLLEYFYQQHQIENFGYHF